MPKTHVRKGDTVIHVHGDKAGQEGVWLAHGQVQGIYDAPVRTTWKRLSSAVEVWAPAPAEGLAKADRVVLETCPSSTLKRLGLPFRGYKDPGKASPSPEKVAVRRGILAAIEARARVPRALAERAMQDPGGDALDAMLAALGALEGFTREDHRALAEERRQPEPPSQRLADELRRRLVHRGKRIAQSGRGGRSGKRL